MSERLPNRETLAIDHHADQPVTSPPEIGYRSMLELGVAVWAQDQEVTWVVADLWVEMMYLEIRFAVPFYKSERTELTFPVVQFSEQDANSRGYTLVALGRTWKHPWTWSARRILSNPQQLSLRQLSRALSCQARQNP